MNDLNKDLEGFQKLLIKASKRTALFLRLCFKKSTPTFMAYVLHVYVEVLKESPEFNNEYYENLLKHVTVTKN